MVHLNDVLGGLPLPPFYLLGETLNYRIFLAPRLGYIVHNIMLS